MTNQIIKKIMEESKSFEELTGMDFIKNSICKNCKNYNGTHCIAKGDKASDGYLKVEPTGHCNEFDRKLDEEIAEQEEAEKRREEVLLPQEGKLISEFCIEISDILKKKNCLFFRPDSRDIVEIGKVKIQKTGEEIYTGFIKMKPNRFITLIENYFIPGHEIWNEHRKCLEFKKKSMGKEIADTSLHSDIMQQSLPQINRIFTIPIPIMYEGKLTFPNRGYDERFCSWLPHNAPKIEDSEMKLEDAKKMIEEVIMSEFCFRGEQDKINAISALLTPFLRGMFNNFHTRTPVTFYLGNRERVGKDYLAGVSGIIYEGYALEESPISTSENTKTNHTDELRKKILAAMIGGRKRLHFSNNKGYINNAVFEAVTTAEKYSDRVLGRNEVLQFDNEIDYSLSGNVGVGYTPDFANRSRFIRLFLDIEDANSREFKNPDLHKWVRENRGKILSALYALVRNWIDGGMQGGKIKFTSFPEWARVCGGIMEAAGYTSPCTPDIETLAFGGDSETDDMKQLFELCYEKHGEKWITKSEIKSLILDERHAEKNLFGYIDFASRAGQTKFGNKISKFVGRVLSDIRLVVQDGDIRASRQQLKFTKEELSGNKNQRLPTFTREKGQNGNPGNTPHQSIVFTHNRREGVEPVTKVDKVTTTEMDKIEVVKM